MLAHDGIATYIRGAKTCRSVLRLMNEFILIILLVASLY
jgi:hypothetical protein